jgi:NTP pyrophosphatase (non-canonical NTP hydrolase)
MTFSISDAQMDHDIWARRNFPTQYQHIHQPLLGIVEEVGELAHAHLKEEQGIRGTPEEHRIAAHDALGDIFIYMMSYANVRGWDLEHIIARTWAKVSKRDWVADPLRGGE